MRIAQLILVRHAATAANQQRPYVLQGSGLDNPLSELGLRQAEAVAAALADLPIAAVYSSPLSRAMQTAERISTSHGHPPQRVAELTEADIGVWDGLSWEQIAQRWPEEHRAFHDDPSQWGYLQGENFEQVRVRCVAALEQLVSRHEGQTIVVVGHNVVNRVALAHWMGIPVRWARKVPQDNGGYSVVRFVDGVAAPRTINSAQHLSALTSAE